MTILTMYHPFASLNTADQTQITNYIAGQVAAGTTDGQIQRPTVTVSPYDVYRVLTWNSLASAQNFQIFLSGFAVTVNLLQQFAVNTEAVWDRDLTAEESQALCDFTFNSMGTPVGDPASCKTFGISNQVASPTENIFIRYWADTTTANAYAALLNSFDPPPTRVTVV